jgi:hypothetical protein
MADYRDLTLTLHGLDEYNQAVDGEVFAWKFAAFMRGLGRSDAAANGKRRYKFLISDLKKNTATAVVREQLAKKGASSHSGITYYLDGVSSVYGGTPQARALPRELVRDIAILPKGAGHTFSFAEVKGESTSSTSAPTVIRIDEFLESRAKRILREVSESDPKPRQFFEGTAYGSFDGLLKAVDLRGDMKKAVLLLSAGGKPIECIVNAITVPELGDALDQRVLAYGLAHYARASGLPVRVDVRKLEVLKDGQGLDKWRGHFSIPADARDAAGWERS